MQTQKLVFVNLDNLYGAAKKALYKSGRELMPAIKKTSVIETHPFFNPTTPIKIEKNTSAQNI